MITEALHLEGISRDVIRHIQELRKKADFDITDRIKVWVADSYEELDKAVAQHKDTIMSETLCVELNSGAPADGAVTEQIELVKNGPKFTLAVLKV